jgi:hypothetical protein
VICPSCGARNGERAAWCSQCFAALGETSAATHGVAPPPTAADAAGPEPPPPVPGAAAVQPGSDDRDVRVRDEQVEWRCPVCRSWSPLLEAACRGCGRGRAGFMPTEAVRAREPRAGAAVSLVASALLPGVGHLLWGVTGLGLAVLLLWSLWVGGAVASRAGAAPVTVVLVLAAVALWVVSLLDLRRRSTDAAPVLTGRLLAWSTVVVTGLLVLAAITGALAARG